ncbi:MAG: 2-succinyl-5-enolpyruvyl-6-hydroxy-3-cyclohexene-1-carboxylic-acid synthase, partial [Actinobacteria bacterium]|nr:2-succinyl-5-enolpyruvyl-6-hydroxy-3-cyclohexene-1-carboxylic-acid synthase [Actinomycetota bacterium]
CPGSRSAPLAYALVEALENRPDDVQRPGSAPDLHVRHDERVAAFTALGVARGALAGGADLAGAVVTTSGTAAANLLPAVLEAHHGNVPLVVVTADRPTALRGTWANQTTELQAGLFGDAVRARLDLADDVAAADPDAARAALLDTLQAMWGRTVDDRPGPVHLDLGFTDPLVPDDDSPALPSQVRADAIAERTSSGSPSEVRAEQSIGDTPAAPSVRWVVRHRNRGARGEPLLPGGRTVVVAGDGAGWEARWLAEAGGWPLLAEPSSAARSGPNAIGPYRLLLELPDLGGAVERAIVLGRPTLSRPVSRLLARDDVEVVLVSPYPGWPEPGRTVRRILGLTWPGDLDETRKGWYRRDPDAWLAGWLAAGAAAQQTLDGILDEVAAGWSDGASAVPLGPLVAREVAATLRPGDLLVAAASNPIRDLDLAGRPFGDVLDREPGVVVGDQTQVVANRGLAGIDGTLSTACGAALARDGAPVRVLVGDLAFLHDANALLSGPAERRPDLQVVLLDDDGGGIFSLLEHGERAARGADRAALFERTFGTPHGTDVAELCRA